MSRQTAEKILEMIEKSPTAFHAVELLKEKLEESGFSGLKETESWNLRPGGRYYVIRNHSSLISFILPAEKPSGFRLIASHSDSPCFKLKTSPETESAGVYVRLNTERYGGMILSSWFDRPLSIAGRILAAHEGELEEILINLEQELLMIPSLAIHMDPRTNKGVEFNVQNDLLPVMTQILPESRDNDLAVTAENSHLSGNQHSKLAEDITVADLIAARAGVEKEDILGADLFVYNRMPAVFWGADREYIASPRLDDLECCFSTFLGFLEAAEESGQHSSVRLHAVFDNEEVGSGTAQGADSTFLAEILERISLACGCGREEYMAQVASSIMLSADNAHAVHPAHVEKADPVNRPVMNRGLVIKHNANQKYTTDAVSEAMVVRLCKEHNIPFQHYANRSDMAGGSTLGNIAQSHVSMKAADIGLAQLAMHSSYESAGAEDPEYMKQLASVFYREL